MAWAVFIYDHKGLMFIWEKETEKAIKFYKNFIDEWNTTNEARLRTEWEREKGMSRLGLKGKPGRKPAWKFDKHHGKMVREGKGGIDWIRYRYEVLIPYYWPFLDSLPGEKSDWTAQEDNAPAHASK